MFEARKLNARSGGRVGRRIEKALDLDDRRRRFARLAEELEAERPDGRWHPVQHEARADDDAVAPFLLHARQPCEELVGDVLAETHLAEEAPGNGEHFAPRHGAAIVTEPFELEGRSLRIVDLAEVVIDARHLQPLRIRRHHPPRDEVIECRAPQHGLLATGVDGDIAADARRIRRRRIAREHESVRIGNVHRAFRDDPCAAVDRRDRFRVPLQRNSLDAGESLELLGVDHRRARVERDRAAGIARAAAARNDRQAELDARGDDAAHFVFRIRMQHDEWVLDAPVGCVGHVRYALEAVERDVVLARMAAKRALHAFSQCCGVAETISRSDRRPRARRRAIARPSRRDRRRGPRCPCGARRSRSDDGAARRRAAAGAADCRAGRPADTDCARRPRCRRALRTASAPSGRCGARPATPRAAPTSARRAAGSRSRDRKTTCSCTGFRAGGTFPCANPASRQPVRRAHSSERTMIPQRALRSGERTRDINGIGRRYKVDRLR